MIERCCISAKRAGIGHRPLTNITIALLFMVFVACRDNGTSYDNDDNNSPKVTTTDAPDDLVVYFDSLLQFTPAFIYTRNVDDIHPNPDSLAILESIKALDEFQANRNTGYPRPKVGDALGHLIFAQWHYDTHGDGEDDEMAGSEEFLLHYLEQAARLCPHVDYLTSIHTGDDKAGIFTGHEFSSSHQPFYSILLYRYGNGYRTKFLQHYIGYDKIWELSDSIGRNYLLCYNGETDIDMGFRPFKATLFLEVGGDYQEVCTSDDWIDMEEYDNSNYSLDYNPQTITWTKCSWVGYMRIPIPCLKKLRLVLDGEQSHFVKL